MDVVIESAKRAKAAVRALSRLSSQDKKKALLAIAAALRERSGDILSANEIDLNEALPLVESRKMSEALYRRLKLDSHKLEGVIRGVEEIAEMNEPLGAVTRAIELDEGLKLYRVTCPIGVIGVIFESRPDALVQIASLCLKSGNAILLKGGREAEKTNRMLFEVIQQSLISSGLPSDALTLLESREDVNTMLKAEGYVDLIIPRGSNELVRYIQNNTSIPVLGHAEGLCHIYVDRSARVDMAVEVIVDAKVSYPSACNAVETVLIHSDIADLIMPKLVETLRSHGVEIRGDQTAIAASRYKGLIEATEQDWQTEYCDMTLSIKVVPSLEAAIEHINTYGSHHTDAIITEDSEVWDRFFAEVDSAGVYLNASTRFADGYRYGFGAEVGISTGKLHPRGPVGLEGLVSYKYKLVGTGQTTGEFEASGKRFTHRPLHDQET